MSPKPNTEILCACPPSHRRLRRSLSAIIVVLALCLIGTLSYLALTGGFTS